MPDPGRKLALALSALASSAAAAELGYRVLAPGPHASPVMRNADGSEKPLAEIAAIVRDWREGRARSGPCTSMRPDQVVLFCYDRPELPYFDEQGCVEVRTNHFGFRDREFEVAKKPGEFRILAPGDSFTFGSGVRAEDAWPEQLELRLRARLGGPLEVINAGFAAGSHFPGGYADWVESDGLAFAPDVLVVGLCLNDLHLAVPMSAEPVVRPEPWLGGVSRLLYRAQCALEQARLDGLAIPDASLLVQTHPELWQECQAGLRRIRDLCRARGVRLVVAVLPMLSLLEERYPYLGLHSLVQDFCAAEAIERVDLLDRDLYAARATADANAGKLYLLSDGCALHAADYYCDDPYAPPSL